MPILINFFMEVVIISLKIRIFAAKLVLYTLCIHQMT